MRLILAATLASCLAGTAHADAIFDQGTAFFDNRIIGESDPTAFTQLTYKGVGEREMFDRRSGWVRVDAFLFDVTFSDGRSAETQVNPEFGSIERAEAEARRFAEAIGRLPSVLRSEMETIWIHAGDQDFGGGNKNFLIHTDRADLYGAALHEILVHEGVHTSLDPYWAMSSAWRKAQEKDGLFISRYALENPEREDLAETFLVWMASRYVPDRVDAEKLALAEKGNAARFSFLDTLNLDMSPFILKR